jgi:hypothetical protein
VVWRTVPCVRVRLPRAVPRSGTRPGLVGVVRAFATDWPSRWPMGTASRPKLLSLQGANMKSIVSRHDLTLTTARLRCLAVQERRTDQRRARPDAARQRSAGARKMLTLNTATAPISRRQHDLRKHGCSRESCNEPQRPDVQIQRVPGANVDAGLNVRSHACTPDVPLDFGSRAVSPGHKPAVQGSPEP